MTPSNSPCRGRTGSLHAFRQTACTTSALTIPLLQEGLGEVIHEVTHEVIHEFIHEALLLSEKGPDFPKPGPNKTM